MRECIRCGARFGGHEARSRCYPLEDEIQLECPACKRWQDEDSYPLVPTAYGPVPGGPYNPVGAILAAVASQTGLGRVMPAVVSRCVRCDREYPGPMAYCSEACEAQDRVEIEAFAAARDEEVHGE